MNAIFRVLLCSVLLIPALAQSHSLNDSYLDIEFIGQSVTGSLRVAIPDLEIAVGIDGNNDGNITWKELTDRSASIDRYIQQNLLLRRDEQACLLVPGNYQIANLTGGAYLQVSLAGECAASRGTLNLEYRLLFAVDTSHRGIATLRTESGMISQVFAPYRTNLMSDLSHSSWRTLQSFITEGVWHIWLGLDHVLFLLAMLIAVTMQQQPIGSGTKKDALHGGLGVVRMITAFTVAHSLTLVLATLELVSLPARLVESVIALSVVLSGINIIYPLFRDRHWQFAFAFGLVHGFGFANVLGDLELSGGQFALSLLGFNIGVELGQLVLVLLALPALKLARRFPAPRSFVATASGLGIAQIGLLWFMARGFNLQLLL